MTLIEQLEAATGPDRELDLTIYLNLRPESELAAITKYRRGLDSADGYSWDISHGTVIFQKMQDGRCPHNGGYPLPAFTGSLDAARSICKDALIVTASEIGADGLPMVRLVTDTSTSPVIDYIGIASTIELAWCIAALRARGVILFADLG